MLEGMVFEFYPAVEHVRSVVKFKNSYLPLFSNSDTKLVFFGKNLAGKIPNKRCSRQSNQIIPNQTSLDEFVQ